MLESWRGPDLSCTADRAERLAGQHRSSETLFISVPPSRLHCVFLFPSIFLYLPLSILITLCCFIFLPPSSSLPSFLSPYISVWYPPSVICCLPLLPPSHPPVIFTPSIQFTEFYWYHKMNFTVSLSGTFVFLLLILHF